MSQYRKKPVVIEASQWFKEGDHPAVIRQHAIDPPTIGWVPTLEGGHQVTPGDWIITGVKGEHYPCKPDIFEMTYEPAQPPGEAATLRQRKGHSAAYPADEISAVQPTAEARDAARLALDALETCRKVDFVEMKSQTFDDARVAAAITALRAAMKETP